MVECLQSNDLLLQDTTPAAATANRQDKRGQIRTDSRKVEAGDIFIAIKGAKHDGNDYLTSTPAGLIISEQPQPSLPTLVVTDARQAWSHLAARSNSVHDPAQCPKIIAITGTNGKTTTASLISQLLSLCSHPPLLVSSLGIFHGNDYLMPNQLTTPDPDLLFRLLALANEAQIPYVVLEVSSHALALQKLAPLRFCAAAITSFSPDHLDFHQDLQHYFTYKWQLLAAHSRNATCIALSNQVAKQAKDFGFSFDHPNLWVYGDAYSSPAYAHLPDHHYLRLSTLSSALGKLRASLCVGSSCRVTNLTLPGKHNLFNFAAALLLVEHLLGKEVALSKWSQTTLPHGRMEIVSEQPLVIVDYAHTPDALEQILLTLAKIQPLWLVFGCGGERDRSKRKLMGEVAARLATHLVLTDDNPRQEQSSRIIANIMAGIPADRSPQIIPDRRAAIAYALAKVQKNSAGCVLVAGRGAEPYQQIAGRSIAFDDRLVCQQLLKQHDG